ncbi:MAG TPA: helix-turn-helix transcriptional regulator [Candidatus Saccharimonadales bacterium]|nr:helix-turn-helix transcriptional regulator [Candidatus Saccharimonadales bacterium]
MNDINQAASRQIKEARRSRKLSQQAVADATGLTRTSISNIENGRQALSLELFCKLADTLNISPVTLLEELIRRDNSPSVTKNDVEDDRIRRIIRSAVS